MLSFCYFIFNWGIIALQYYVGFCHTSTLISHRYTYVPSILSLPPTSHPPPHPTPLVCYRPWFEFLESYSIFLPTVYFIYGSAVLCCVCSVVSNSLHPMDCSSPGSFVHGIFQARILEWVAISFSRWSSQTRDWNHVSYISCIGRQILYQWATGKAKM